MKFSRIVRLTLFCALALGLAGCSDDSPEQGIAEGPCPGEAGFGARVSVDDGPIDVCVPDDEVWTVLTSDGWYDVTVDMIAGDGTVYSFHLAFPNHDTSRALNVTGDLAEARADPNGAWFYYREDPEGSSGIESAGVVSGSFRLGFSDGTVVAGRFEQLELEMQTVVTRDAAGTRMVLEGFFSILVDAESPGITH